jgi:hypothetical protein
MFAQIPRISPPPRIWEAIAAELDRSQAANQGRAVAAAAPTFRVGQTWLQIALAASILLIVGTGLWWARPSSTAHDHASHHGSEFVSIMDRYLRTLDSDPDAAERFLREQYQGKEVSPEQAVELVGFQPAIASGIPSEYRLASTSVLTMPCCTCVKTVCKRADGSTLVLFEHDDDAMQWFGSRPTRMATCGEHECCLVDLSENIAATWKHGSRWLTAIGLQDPAEAGRLADWLADKVSADGKSLDNGLDGKG